MYSNIQQLKEDGLNKAQVERKLGIDYKTVSKYWDMTADEFEAYKNKTKTRRRKLSKYKDYILKLLYRHNDYKISQIHDLLEEEYSKEKNNIKYSTLRLYIKKLRRDYNIPKKNKTRQYQAIPDPPMGYQAQLDLGEIKLENTLGSYVKLYAIAMVLSNSRYKYIEWFDFPPKVGDLTNFHEKAFNYYGGMPQEIVYDQDKLVIVDENYGDIIYTAKFEAYRQQKKFKTYICRSSDPESKGRVESVVKYAKYNFAKYRIFTNLKEFNELCWSWLKRTGNGKIHGTTKKIPAEVFKKEKEYLRPVTKGKIKLDSTQNIISRKVRKDNTIVYCANRYSLPLGTYEPGKEVGLIIKNDKNMKIIAPKTGELIAKHSIHQGKGKLISNSNHQRDYSQKIEELYNKTLSQIGDEKKQRKFLDKIKVEKPRYIRDQYLLIIKIAKELTSSEILKVINYCIKNDCWSANDFKSAANNLSEIKAQQEDNNFTKKEDNQIINPIYSQETEIRDLSEYEQIER